MVVTWRGAGIGGRIVLVILWYYCGTSTCSYLKKISTVRKRRKKEHTDGSRRICVSSPKDRVDVFDVMGFVDDNVFEKTFFKAAVSIKHISYEVIHTSLVPASVTILKSGVHRLIVMICGGWEVVGW